MDIILRLLGGDNINDILVILLDDLERTFESEEEALASMVLKVRLNSFNDDYPTKEKLELSICMFYLKKAYIFIKNYLFDKIFIFAIQY